jgi:SpoVK/Ycf46/Vps4 family AAA+-type ATPase
LTGLESIKSEINSIVSLARIARIKQEKGEPAKPVIGHFVFNGNPGTGKTTVARLLGEIFASLGLLSSGHTVEVGRVDLVGEYLGQTAPKVKEKVQSAMGGVLFIDEAYSLQSKNKTDTYGKEAIDTLVQLMENHRDNLVVILAGYKVEMKDLIVMNSGLKSRISYDLDFENYDSSSSLKIFTNLVEANNMIPDEEFVAKASNILINLCEQPGYANARSIRELFEYALKQQALRLNSMQSKRIEISDLKRLMVEDLPEVKKIKVVEKAPLGFI